MSLHVWLAFIVAAILISLSPGAGAISCMASGMRYGYRRSLPNIGIAAVKEKLSGPPLLLSIV